MGAQNHAPEAALVEEFTRLYYAEVDPEELAAREPIDLKGAAAAHLAFGRRFPGGAPKVRAYNPALEQHGWQSTHTVIDVVGDDMPFLVDSVTMEVNRQGLTLHLLVHPVLRVTRGAKGELASVTAPSAGAQGRLESFMHLEVDRQTDPARLAGLEAGIAKVLGDVRAAVEDWRPMQARMLENIKRLESVPPGLPQAELEEARAFLAWLLDHHFTFLGCRDYELASAGGEDELRIVPGSGLGILRARAGETVSASFAALPAEARKRARVKEVLLLTKASSRSTVHRPGHLDYVGVKHFDAAGEVRGETRFLGLYTHTAYSENPMQVPLLRRKLAEVIERAGLLPAGYSGKALASILETYPRDELLQIGAEDLYRHAMAIVQLGERQRTRLLVRQDPYARFVSCLIFVPRERYNTELRQRFQRILTEAFNGQASEFEVNLSGSTLGRILMRIRTRPGEPTPAPDAKTLERRLVEAMRRWEDDLCAALLERHGEERGNALWRSYERAFAAGYRDEYSVRSAVVDIDMMEALAAETPGLNLYAPPGADRGIVRFKIYRRGERVALSDSLPMLERLGVRVLDEHPHKIEPAGGDPVWVVDFGLSLPAEAALELDKVRGKFHEAFLGMWSGTIEADDLNRLVLAAGLDAREISVLRAYTRYLIQAGSSFSRAYAEHALVANARIAAMLVRLFVARFRNDKENEAALATEIAAALDAVQNLDEDRILRSFLAVIQASVRTNYFHAKPYLAFKLDSRRVPGLPEPRPLCEIWVHSPRVEAVHLRGGRVARGGIRWSDRMEDFRTEVLGLMKAQMVKNVVIVPVGAKGGFVLKRPPPSGEREALMKEGIACYQTFLRGLLDLTDNLVDGKVKPPQNVVRHDGDDPYLVVAADKGTASFSDIANAVAAEYGFWLGDAFASGGSAGYDHKKMAITARGAWESVKRHFRELGVDTQTQDFTVAGIGDMSGDVFGNGMLLSRHIRLVAAFDHRHIFLDPSPDPEKSCQERERLFRLPRSSWADYDASLISKGGGVFPRSAKSISLSPEVQEVLGVEAKALAPAELVNAILKAPVDLLYNGGIGTYVKATRQSHADVGDRANDAVRVNGAQLRCRVVAEGGNLGFTQLGRIEYALAGGRINTDAIDNSAGVDCSDHEVNIKILLDALVRAGELAGRQRNKLLSDMTEDVAALVLRDNYFQTQSLSVSGALAPTLLDTQERFIKSLEKSGRLNRALEFLPNDEEFAERRAAKLGLSAPERAVLLAYSKIALYDEILHSDVPEEPFIASALERYFPEALRSRFKAQIHAHPLRREIIATHVANSMINRVGSTFVHRMREETGATAPDVVRAYLIVREAFGMVEIWRAVEALDYKVADRIQTALLIDAGRLIVRATLWFLRNRAQLSDLGSSIEHFRAGTERLAALLPQILPAVEESAFRAAASRLEKDAVPKPLCARAAGFDALFSALDIVEVADALKRDIDTVARLHFALAGELDFPWLRACIGTLAAETHWQRLAKAALRDDLASMLRALTADALRTSAASSDPAALIAEWKSRNSVLYERFRQVLTDLRATEAADFAMLSVALRELRNLSSR
ncbi:MAG: NAD-glutamate dehydrogenase [Betaproteobacteria bacterium RIFCSPLOWO2_12_FULL_65_14]|nr:MAG: NAD-glutamate dehydrogenase [Betaproteobacteria bacterium RIFCSPLOWO2_12_FULL_65_14]